MANTIDSGLMLSTYKNNQASSSKSSLGKDDFLKILMTQLQNQDPTNPLQDKDFVAQMATFSSLEQLTNMNSEMDQLVQGGQQNQFLQYSQLVGKQVDWQKAASQDGSDQSSVSQGAGTESGNGKISGVRFKDNTVSILLEDGTELDPKDISEINQ